MTATDENNTETNGNKLPNPNTQAQWFTHVRHAHQRETAEDYVKLIADLLNARQEARLSDLAARLGVSSPTVSKVLSRLKNEGYIESRPYRSIFLTPKGWNLAQACKKRHQTVLDFLIALGVSYETAPFDAEGMKHHISEETLNLFQKFTRAQEYRLTGKVSS
ncbi:MAG: manganese-binding transcriptional regulator MntR [Alphaproteobacteria bacterium]|nr:manganese-binding transcriptional regulator MntR [Alphaproteobacteria bacterium]